jgi:hypothetical protein
MTNPSPTDLFRTKINIIFPSLSTLLSVEPDIMNSMLLLRGLAKPWKGKGVPSSNAWQLFIAEMWIDNELQPFQFQWKVVLHQDLFLEQAKASTEVTFEMLARQDSCT